MEVTKRYFGKTKDGIDINSFVLTNDKQMEVEILEFGAIVRSLNVPDRYGNIDDVVLGFDSLKMYEEDKSYFGAVVGRVANRIGTASVVIGGERFELAPNALPDFGHNHLHGGVKGFNKKVWKGEAFEKNDVVGVKLTCTSDDGDEGYPGNLDCEVLYSLNNSGEFTIRMSATTDRLTVVNFTHHNYFNLAGEGKGKILDSLISINADKFTPSDEDMIPTGEIKEVYGLPEDFTSGHPMGYRLDEMQRVKYTGYDTNYVLNHKKQGGLDLAVTVTEPVSGRKMEVYTTQPCMHFYTGNFLDVENGKGGKRYGMHEAFCLEPQGYPDAPNKKNFESIELKPGEKYEQTIMFKFPVVSD